MQNTLDSGKCFTYAGRFFLLICDFTGSILHGCLWGFLSGNTFSHAEEEAMIV